MAGCWLNAEANKYNPSSTMRTPPLLRCAQASVALAGAAALPLRSAGRENATRPVGPIGISQGVPCVAHDSAVRWTSEEEYRYVLSNSIPIRADHAKVMDYCPFGIGGLYCGIYQSCPSGKWGVNGEECVPPGSGIVLDPHRPGSPWGTVAEDKDDCPNPSWYTSPCPQQDNPDIGDCLRPYEFHYRIPLRAFPVMSSVGPQKYDRAHGVGLDGVDIWGPREVSTISTTQG
jgi:hypothetical protein